MAWMVEKMVEKEWQMRIVSKTDDTENEKQKMMNQLFQCVARNRRAICG